MKIEKELEIEHRLTGVETTLNDIKDNHLHEIKEDIKDCKAGLGSLNIKFATWGGGIAVTVVVLQLIISHYFK